jgi:hypothetical protein
VTTTSPPYLVDLERATLRNTLITLADRPLTQELAGRLTSLDPLLLVGVSAAAAGDEEGVDAVVTRFLATSRVEG